MLAAVVMALATTLIVAACGGGGSSETRATLTDEGCTYEGNETPSAGPFTVEIENQTFYFGAFALASLTEGSTIDDIEPFFKKARRQFERTGEAPRLPAPWETVATQPIEPSTSSVLLADVPAGSYVLVCFVDDNSDLRRSADDPRLPKRVYAALELEVK